MQKPETKFVNKVKDDLKKLQNLWFFKTQEVAVRGIPDLILCLNGYFIAMEAKKDEVEEPDALQEYNGNRIHKKGKGRFFKIDPLNWDATFEVLQAIDSGPSAYFQLSELSLLKPLHPSRVLSPK